MKKLWTLFASSLLLASVSFAQDDFESEYEAQAEEQVADQPSDQFNDQTEDQAADQASEPAEEDASTQTANQNNDQVANQTNIQQANQVNIQNNYYAQAEPSNTQNDDYAESKPAVNKTGFGLRLAFDYGRMFGFKDDLDNDSDISGTPSGFGFEGGLMVRVQMIPNLFFAPEINVAYISTNHEYMDHERKYTTTDLEIPLMLRGIIADKFYVTGGAQINLTLNSKSEIDPIVNVLGGGVNIKTETTEKVEQATFGLGIVAGAGFNIVGGLFVDLRFYMGLSELYPDVKSLDDYENGDIAEEGEFSLINMSGARMMKFKAGISYWFM